MAIFRQARFGLPAGFDCGSNVQSLAGRIHYNAFMLEIAFYNQRLGFGKKISLFCGPQAWGNLAVLV
jgi:hypothetical protein